MIPSLAIETVTERDIDLLLCEEWSVNEDFRRRFLRRVSPALETAVFKKLLHSVSDAALGESDLLMLLDHGNHQHALLIENKIDALPQPEQAVRYEKRGAAGLQLGHWTSYCTCMIAPASYLAGTDDAQLYQVRISYEELAEDLTRSTGIDEARKRYRLACLAQAIEQNRRGYCPKPSPEVSDFWTEYWKEATRSFPHLHMAQPGSKPGESSWIRFNPGTISGRLSLQHKTGRGAVDLKLAYPSERLAECRAALAGLIDPDMQVVPTTAICSLRLTVPPMDTRQPFAPQRDHALAAMHAATRIAQLCPRIQDQVRR